MPISKVLILGGGISGVAAAIALSKYAKVQVEIFEIRDSPATIGGAINLTPNALRCLDYLGVYEKLASTTCEVPRIDIFALRTGEKLCDLDFDDVASYKFRARRVLRMVLLNALLDTLSGCGVRVQYGKRAVGIENGEEQVRVKFSDGAEVAGNVLVGADGIHSFVRMTEVQKERVPTYTGIAGGYGLLEASKLSQRFPFESTGMYSGRRGSLMISYHDHARQQLYVAVVMETAAPEAVESNENWEREGWRAKGADVESMREDILDRMGGSPEPLIDEVVKATKDWFLYPVYKLTPKGRWWKGRCILVGDAAHAMPPQGESIGLALEDVVLLSRLIHEHGASKSTLDIFSQYDSLRRDRIEAAFDEATSRWETVKDKGWFAGLMIEKLTPWVLWFGKGKREQSLKFDVRDLNLG